MELLLIFLFGSVGLGLITERLDRRTYSIILAMTTVALALYYFTTRFMT